MDRKVLREIREEAERAGTSINSKINEILLKHITFYKKVEELQCIIIPPVYSLMLARMDEREGIGWLEMAINNIWGSLLLEYDIPHDMVEFVKFVFGNIGLRAGLYSSFRSDNDNGYLRLVFNHKYGAKWSRMLAEAFSYALDSYFNMVPEGKITDATIELKVFAK